MKTGTTVFVTGGTGYMGRRLIAELCENGYRVVALARPGSEHKLPAGCEVIVGDALSAESYAPRVPMSCTFVHLVGVAHPSPAKAKEFRSIDLVSLQAAVSAAVEARVEHFVYVSVAQPAPVMIAYQKIRAECEQIIAASKLKATILRPWYVLGPGHRWPYLLLPLYWVAERIPRFRQSALRLGLVTLDEMVGALVRAVKNPSDGNRIVDVGAIRGR